MVNSRMRKILNLLQRVDKAITSEQICNIVGVSSRTVRNDIKELNYILKENGAIIICEKLRGYELEISNELKFNNWLCSNQSDSTFDRHTTLGRSEYIINTLLINELKGVYAITQATLADELYVSLSSLKNDIKFARMSLLDFNVRIDKIGNKGIRVTASEEDIRNCICTYTLRGAKILEMTAELLFEETFLKKCTSIEDIIKKNLKEFNFRLSDNAYNRLRMHAILMIIRNSKNKNITYDKNTRRNLENENQNTLARKICDDIEKSFNVILVPDEILYITKYIVSSSRVLIENNIEDSVIVKKILAEIKEVFNVDLTGDEILIMFLSNHLKIAINKAKYGIKIRNTMLNLIKINYPFAVELALLTNEIIEKELSVTLVEDEIGFIALHFAAAIERYNEAQNKIRKKVIIVCTTGIGTSLLLKVKLESHFKHRLNIIDTISCYEFSSDVLEKVDLVISTIDLQVDLSKVVFIKNLLDVTEIELIEQKINENIYQKDSIAHKLKKELFFKNLMFSDKQSLLKFMTNELIKAGYINEFVCENIFEREKIASTEIGSSVAIPHVMTNELKESFITVAILKKSIMWDQEQVQLVLLIGLAANDKNEWKQHLEHLYRKVVDVEIVKNIINCNNFEELTYVMNKF